MNVQGHNVVAGLAGTSRAQAKGTDTQTSQVAGAATGNVEKPGDELSIDPSDKSQDRGGDGRQPYAITKPEEQDDDQTHDAPRRPASIDGCGEELDLDA